MNYGSDLGLHHLVDLVFVSFLDCHIAFLSNGFVCMYPCVGRCTCVCRWVWRPEVNLRCQSLDTLVLETGCFAALEVANRLGCLSSKSHQTACFYLFMYVNVTSFCFVTWALGFELRFLCLQDKQLTTDSSLPLFPPFPFSITTLIGRKSPHETHIRSSKLGLERWLCSQEHLLLLQRIQVRCPAHTWQLITVYNSSFRDLMPSSVLHVF